MASLPRFRHERTFSTSTRLDMPSSDPTPGTKATATLKVRAEDTAAALSFPPYPTSQNSERDVFPAVFSTNNMVALSEVAAARILAPHLAPGEASVGVEVSTRHLAATLPGDTVRAVAEYTGREGKLYRFEIVCEDSGGRVGVTVHTRAAVAVERLLAGAAKRAGAE